MTVLDADAVIAYVNGEPAAPEVEPLLRGRTTLTAVGVAEVLDYLVRIGRRSPSEAVLDLAQLGLLAGHPVTPAIGVRAGLLRARRYQRDRCSISMADCVAAEISRDLGRPLATADRHLLDVCLAESIPMHVLTDRDGRRWKP